MPTIGGSHSWRYGNFILNVGATIALPNPVTALAAGVAGSNNVPLSWVLPVAGGAIASITINYRANGTSPWLLAGTAAGNATAYVVYGLNPITAYDFQVVSVNATGQASAQYLNVSTSAGGSFSLLDVTIGVASV